MAIDKFTYAKLVLLRKIHENDGIRFSQLSKQEQKLAEYMAKRGKVTFEPIYNDWIVR